MLVQVPAEYAAFANELADAAGAEILRYWRQPYKIDEKFESGRAMASSPVTEADRAAEMAMRRLIAARYPSHGVKGEEFGASPNKKFGETVKFDDADWQWVLDPIDGTKSFMTGKPVFGTLVALCKNGDPVVGVIDQCVLKERWIGCVGAVTTLNGVPISSEKTPSPTELDNAFAYATTPDMFAPGFETDRFLEMKGRVKRMLFGCDCYAYALLASGFGPSIVVEADLQPYDFLALVPVVRGAGGFISDWNGNPLTLTSQSSGRVIAAKNDKLYHQALDILSAPSVRAAASSKAMTPKRSIPLPIPALAFAAGAAAAVVLSRAFFH